MKKVSVKKGAACMACLECVRACSQAFYKEFHQYKACIQVVTLFLGTFLFLFLLL